MVTSLVVDDNCGGVVLSVKSGSTPTNGFGLSVVPSLVVPSLLPNKVVKIVLITPCITSTTPVFNPVMFLNFASSLVRIATSP